jgi:hypothetical protein
VVVMRELVHSRTNAWPRLSSATAAARIRFVEGMLKLPVMSSVDLIEILVQGLDRAELEHVARGAAGCANVGIGSGAHGLEHLLGEC